MRSDRSGPIAGVVLAAGSSSRMGRNKLLFDLGGRSVVHAAVEVALGARLDPVVLVLGHEAEAVRASVDGLACRFVLNPNHASGMNSSVCTGIESLPSGVSAAVVLLADMPFVTANMIAQVVARYRAGNARLLVCEYDGVQAPPTLFDRSLFAALAGPEGGGCAKRMRRRFDAEAEVMAWPAAALADLDVPADYARIRAQLVTN
ncbi:MAG TPA: nucleotidyltransferase family protein [Burkholderiaceae bacterium]|nr:nucleotidyltransferase family protein [Burkholderiaceae bacterium]